MNIKEQENQLSVNLYLRMVVNVVVYLALAAFVGYRLYLVGRLGGGSTVLGVVVPKLKVDSFEELSLSPKATESGVGVRSVSRSEPFD